MASRPNILSRDVSSALRPAVVVILCAVLARAAFLQAFSIPSDSMSPTLEPGDQIMVMRYREPFNRPQRGDIAVFRSPLRGDEFMIKRLVGLPGDHIEIRGGVVWCNGRPLAEPYLRDRTEADNMPPVVVPDHRYFMLGDHRIDSLDSREWGTLPETMLVGRASMIFWSRSDVSAPGGWQRVLRPVR